jgi:hypothetical protein
MDARSGESGQIDFRSGGELHDRQTAALFHHPVVSKRMCDYSVDRVVGLMIAAAVFTGRRA